MIHMPRLRSLLLPFFCLLVFAGHTAHAAAPRDKDLKKAEAIVAKLQLLEVAADAHDADVYGKAAAKVYPDLFRVVASLPDGDIKTDLSTAAALYELAYRNHASNDDAQPDCAREIRDTYFQLCRESSDRTRLLLLKAMLHTQWAASAIAYARGDQSEATLESLAWLRAERSTDLALAEEGLRALKELASEITRGDSSAKVRRTTSVDSAHSLDARRAHALTEVERIIASLPRSQVRQMLSNARDAFRDHLFWQLKGAPSRALVVSVNSLDAPDPLRKINLSADDATRAALQNLSGALKFIAKGEQAIAEAKR